MKIYVHRFEPSSQRGEVTIDVPSGAVVLLARVSERMGDGELVLQLPDDAAPSATEPLSMLFLWEDHQTIAGGDSANWRHVGSWSFRSGSWQHAFVRVAKQRRRDSTPTP